MKRWIKASKSIWPGGSYWESIEGDEEFEEAWSIYLAEPEDKVNSELQIFPEPSVQGGWGSVFVFDESTQRRFRAIEVDFRDWVNRELYMAFNSKSAEDYKNKYRSYIQELIDNAEPYEEE